MIDLCLCDGYCLSYLLLDEAIAKLKQLKVKSVRIFSNRHTREEFESLVACLKDVTQLTMEGVFLTGFNKRSFVEYCTDNLPKHLQSFTVERLGFFARDCKVPIQSIVRFIGELNLRSLYVTEDFFSVNESDVPMVAQTIRESALRDFHFKVNGESVQTLGTLCETIRNIHFQCQLYMTLI